MKYLISLALIISAYIAGRMHKKQPVVDQSDKVSMTLSQRLKGCECSSKTEALTLKYPVKEKKVALEDQNKGNVSCPNDDFDKAKADEALESGLREWGDMSTSFFKNNFSEYEEMRSKYQELAGEFEKEMKKYWDKYEAKSLSQDGNVYRFPSYKDEVERLKIHDRYHRKLNALLGDEQYEEFQEVIEDYNRKQELKQVKGQYSGGVIQF